MQVLVISDPSGTVSIVNRRIDRLAHLLAQHVAVAPQLVQRGAARLLQLDHRANARRCPRKGAMGLDRMLICIRPNRLIPLLEPAGSVALRCRPFQSRQTRGLAIRLVALAVQ